MIAFLIFVFIILATMALSWGFTVGLIWLITLCFGWAFSLPVATGIWLIICLITWALPRGGYKDDKRR